MRQNQCSRSARICIHEDDYGEIYLGVPEDKERWNFDREAIVKGFDVWIQETDDIQLPKAARGGHLRYYNGGNDELTEESISLILYVPPTVFSSIEKSVVEGSSRFQIAVHLKCWYFIDPLGHSSLFIDTKNHSLAELANFTATKEVEENSEVHMVNDPNYDGSGIDLKNVNVHIFKNKVTTQRK